MTDKDWWLVVAIVGLVVLVIFLLGWRIYADPILDFYDIITAAIKGGSP